MITRNYQCETCKHVFSLNRRISDREHQQVNCPKCKGKKIIQKPAASQAKTGEKS